jgi:hypothetical protein
MLLIITHQYANSSYFEKRMMRCNNAECGDDDDDYDQHEVARASMWHASTASRCQGSLFSAQASLQALFSAYLTHEQT